VTVTPPLTSVEGTVTVLATRGRESVEDGPIPRVPAVEVTSSRTLTLAARTTGTVPVDTKAARVLLTMANSGDTDLVVPKDTVFLAADGTPFLMDQETRIAAGKSAIQQASAGRAGTRGNVAAGTITTVQDPRFAALKVTNTEPASGGAAEPRPGVTAKDVAGLTAQATDLGQSPSFRAALLTGHRDAIIQRTAKVEIAASDPSPRVGAPGDVVVMTFEVRLTALAVPVSALEELASLALKSQLGGAAVVPGSVAAAETGAVQRDEDSGYLTELRIVAGVAKGITESAVRESVGGKREDDARATLRESYGITEADIDITPGWAPWLPRFGFRIDVTVRAAGPVATLTPVLAPGTAVPTPTVAAAATSTTTPVPGR
jgi:hypothetical protein